MIENDPLKVLKKSNFNDRFNNWMETYFFKNIIYYNIINHFFLGKLFGNLP